MNRITIETATQSQEDKIRVYMSIPRVKEHMYYHPFNPHSLELYKLEINFKEGPQTEERAEAITGLMRILTEIAVSF